MFSQQGGGINSNHPPCYAQHYPAGQLSGIAPQALEEKAAAKWQP